MNINIYIFKKVDFLSKVLITVHCALEYGTDHPGTLEYGTDHLGTLEYDTDHPGTLEYGTDHPGTQIIWEHWNMA